MDEKLKQRFSDPNEHFFNLSGLNFGWEEIKSLAKLLEKNTSVVVLNLSRNKLDERCMALLANSLKSNITLGTLYLCENKISDESAKFVAQIISTTSVTHLNLYSNSIGNDGAKLIANALAGNNSVEKLYLQGNKIGDDGALQIASAIKKKPMRVFNLSGNFITKEVIAQLKSTIINVTLLDLEPQIIPPTSRRSIASARPTRNIDLPIGMITNITNVTGLTSNVSDNSNTGGSNSARSVSARKNTIAKSVIRSRSQPDTISGISEVAHQKQYSTSIESATLNLIQTHQTISKLEDRINKKDTKIAHLSQKLEQDEKLSNLDKKTLAAHLTYTKEKIIITEKKTTDVSLSLAQTKVEIEQLREALGSAYNIIQGLQSHLQQIRKTQIST